ncbi:PEP-CTERM sorting domain-containing protein [Phycisphaerales bacterium AB-hyl4]|uniref:PEP-CTERM sorting domain-containing protein n=1 Tax=Natronomicrosphaera hydrolytica TaxID=3242702 RepID=A0ABV4U927_9BACT
MGFEADRKYMMTSRKLAITLAGLVTGAAVGDAQAVVIDDFTQGMLNAPHGTWSPEGAEEPYSEVHDGLPGEHVLGGVRSIQLFHDADFAATLDPAVDDALRFDVQPGNFIGMGWLLYSGGADWGNEGELGIDLTGGGRNDRIRVTLSFSGDLGWSRTSAEDPYHLNLSSMVWTTGEDGEAVGVRVMPIPSKVAADHLIVDLMFGEFGGSGSGTEADWTSVDAMLLRIQGGNYSDDPGYLTIHDIRAVPEPGSLALLGLSGMAMLWRRPRPRPARVAGPATA